MGAPSIIEAGAECVDGQITKTFIRGSATIVRTEKISLHLALNHDRVCR
jgi:hypothetical protein